MIEIFLCGIVVGAGLVYTLKSRKTDDWYELHDLLKSERIQHSKELRYYKKLVTEISEENMNFRRGTNPDV